MYSPIIFSKNVLANDSKAQGVLKKRQDVLNVPSIHHAYNMQKFNCVSIFKFVKAITFFYICPKPKNAI